MTSRKRSTALAARLNALEEKSQVTRARNMVAAMPPAEFAKYFAEVLQATRPEQIEALAEMKAAAAIIGLHRRIERVIIDPKNDPEAA
jgi:Mg/Co/Ni transporter MgtE